MKSRASLKTTWNKTSLRTTFPIETFRLMRSKAISKTMPMNSNLRTALMRETSRLMRSRASLKTTWNKTSLRITSLKEILKIFSPMKSSRTMLMRPISSKTLLRETSILLSLKTSSKSTCIKAILRIISPKETSRPVKIMVCTLIVLPLKMTGMPRPTSLMPQMKACSLFLPLSNSLRSRSPIQTMARPSPHSSTRKLVSSSLWMWISPTFTECRFFQQQT